jgi:hypothetical protein
MSMISLRLPDSVHSAATALAEKERISVNQLIATAVAEKLSALSAEEIIHERAERGDRNKFLAALNLSPDVPDPNEFDSENPGVEDLIAQQSPNVQNYVRKLMTDIMAADVAAYCTKSVGGDLRFKVPNGLFAEIKFPKRTESIVLRLYFSPDEILDENYKLFEYKTSKQARYDRRLSATEPIPEDVPQHIRKSREFMMNKRR